MQQYEYEVISNDEWIGETAATEQLNAYGKDGWRLVSVSYSLLTFFLIREKVVETPDTHTLREAGYS